MPNAPPRTRIGYYTGSDRPETVHIGDLDIIYFSVPHTGAPQGCVLSPVFNLIYLFVFTAAKP